MTHTNENTYSATNRQGKTTTVVTNLTALEAARVIEGSRRPSDFGLSLANQAKSHRLSQKQLAWLMILAVDAQKPAKVEKPDVVLELPSIVALLFKAAEAGKRLPSVKVTAPSGQVVILRHNRSGGATVVSPGTFNSSDFFGSIDADGRFRPGRSLTEEVRYLLIAVDADPSTVARQHGVATGECSFCARALSTKESVFAGYGPICAEKFGLPWGHIRDEGTVALEAK